MKRKWVELSDWQISTVVDALREAIPADTPESITTLNTLRDLFINANAVKLRVRA